MEHWKIVIDEKTRDVVMEALKDLQAKYQKNADPGTTEDEKLIEIEHAMAKFQ